MNGMSPSLVFGIIRKNHHGGESVPDGAPFLGAPDGAGPFEATAFSYTYYGGKGDGFAEGWMGSYTSSIGYGAFEGPDLEITPLLRHVDPDYGDVDEDGVVDPDDITALQTYINGSGGYQERLDFNEDGQLTQADVTALTTLMNQAGFRSILLGDVNGDWGIDGDDLTAISGQIGKEWGNASFYPQADIDQDGTVTTGDYDLLDAYLGK